jgi:acyl-coenzyme A thioesterase PaaI-like protein
VSQTLPAAGASRLLTVYRQLERLPLGRELFSQGFRFAAPYFRTIPARIESVAPGRVEARMSHMPWVRNHLGGVHAIALCNLAELAMGALAEATVPRTHRWIPAAMSVEYRAKAKGTMHATATLELPDALSAKHELPVNVSVVDDSGTEVFTAVITIYVSPRA